MKKIETKNNFAKSSESIPVSTEENTSRKTGGLMSTSLTTYSPSRQVYFRSSERAKVRLFQPIFSLLIFDFSFFFLSFSQYFRANSTF